MGFDGAELKRAKEQKEHTEPSRGAIDTAIKWIIFVGPVLIAIILMATTDWSGKNEETAAEKAEFAARQERVKKHADRYYYAEAFAKRIVLTHLKAPTTAKFPGEIQPKVITEDQIHWKVSGMVDAQNSFGALIRNIWYVELESTPDCNEYSNWSCWKLTSTPAIISP